MGSTGAELEATLAAQGVAGGHVVVLTGAGISAESGIPTFRGKDGYWKVGSVNYHPTDLATHQAFSAMPDEVWAWYLYRRGVCAAAEPNDAHHALVRLEQALGPDFTLITQNVDGLHRKAGSSAERTFEIHGNLGFMRCDRECTPKRYPLPSELDAGWAKGRALDDPERAALRCPGCGARTRPHVLWFDECYDEERFRFHSSLEAAARASLLVVIGTAGQTNLPQQVVATVAARGRPVVVVDPELNTFVRAVLRAKNGVFLHGSATTQVPPLVQTIARFFAD